MNVEYFVFDGANGSPLRTTAKRYTTRKSASNLRGLTLVFTHCIGAHKEQWEPVIERLFALQAHHDEACRIREAWSFDWQTHGDAGVINRELLKGYPDCLSVYEWIPAIVQFLSSPRMRGHRIMGVGHSAGAATVLLSTKAFPLTKMPYVGLILVEPTIVTRELFDSQREERMAVMDFTVAATAARRDRWPSRQHAFDYFKKRIPWDTWDPRVTRLLTEHGLEDDPSGGVRLKCEKKREAASYVDVEPHFEGPSQLARVCGTVPIHLIWGDRNDLVPEFIQDSLTDITAGRKAASVVKIEDTGHMVVQERPESVAEAISNIINTYMIDTGHIFERSKL